jgi:hypothetical protein
MLACAAGLSDSLCFRCREKLLQPEAGTSAGHNASTDAARLTRKPSVSANRGSNENRLVLYKATQRNRTLSRSEGFAALSRCVGSRKHFQPPKDSGFPCKVGEHVSFTSPRPYHTSRTIVE